jgi:hypothetical protein
MARFGSMLGTWLLVLTMTSCKSGSTAVDKDVDDGPYPNWDSGHRGDSQADTEAPEDTEAPKDTDGPDKAEEWLELDEEWRDCRGTLHITTDAFTWADADPTCTLSGSASLEDGLLTLQISSSESCDGDIPWWLHESKPATYGYEVVGQRLTLIPAEPVGSGTAKQMLNKQFAMGDVDRQRWEMVSSDGDESGLDVCFLPEGPFFSGRYYATDDSCNFLSCGGSATGALQSEDSFTVYTACAGSCPCVGMLYADDVSDKSLSGSWSGVNCSRKMSGEFTATRIDFPDADL